VIAAVIAFALALSGAYAQEGPSSSAPQWQQTVSESGGFSFFMPGRPKFETKQLRGRTGRLFPYSAYMLDVTSRAFMVSYSDYDADTTISLDDAAAGIIGSWENSTVTDRRRRSFYGYTGLALELETPKYHVRFRLFAVGRRLYQIGLVATRDEFSPAEADRFMDSFHWR